MTAGVWQPVQLEAWDDARLTDLHIEQRALSPQAAQLGLVVDYESATSQPATLFIEGHGPANLPARV